MPFRVLKQSESQHMMLRLPLALFRLFLAARLREMATTVTDISFIFPVYQAGGYGYYQNRRLKGSPPHLLEAVLFEGGSEFGRYLQRKMCQCLWP